MKEVPSYNYQKHVVSCLSSRLTYLVPLPLFLFFFKKKNMFFSCLWLIIALSCAGTRSCTFYNFHANANSIHQFAPTFLVPWFFQCYSTLLTSVDVLLSSGKVTTITLEINVKVNCLNSQKTENVLACNLTSERKENYQFTQSLECFLQWWQEIANAEAGLSGPFSAF